jgi:hypothetical protein
LGVIMLGVFSGALQTRLRALNVSSDVQQAVMAQRAELGNIQAPEDLSGASRTAVAEAVDAAFIDGFRIVCYVMTALALVSALVGALTIEPQSQYSRLTNADVATDQEA